MPTLTELSQQTEQLLLAGRAENEVLTILGALEDKLSRYLEKAVPAEKQLLAQERAVVRSLSREYREQIEARRAYDAIWRSPPPDDGGNGKPHSGHPSVPAPPPARPAHTSPPRPPAGPSARPRNRLIEEPLDNLEPGHDQPHTNEHPN